MAALECDVDVDWDSTVVEAAELFAPDVPAALGFAPTPGLASPPGQRPPLTSKRSCIWLCCEAPVVDPSAPPLFDRTRGARLRQRAAEECALRTETTGDGTPGGDRAAGQRHQAAECLGVVAQHVRVPLTSGAALDVAAHGPVPRPVVRIERQGLTRLLARQLAGRAMITQSDARPGDQAAHSVLFDGEQLGNFTVGVSGQLTHQQRGPLALWQFTDSVEHRLELGRCWVGRCRALERLVAGVLGRAPAPRDVDRRVAGDPDEPSAQLSRRTRRVVASAAKQS